MFLVVFLLQSWHTYFTTDIYNGRLISYGTFWGIIWAFLFWSETNLKVLISINSFISFYFIIFSFLDISHSRFACSFCYETKQFNEIWNERTTFFVYLYITDIYLKHCNSTFVNIRSSYGLHDEISKLIILQTVCKNKALNINKHKTVTIIPFLSSWIIKVIRIDVIAIMKLVFNKQYMGQVVMGPEVWGPRCLYHSRQRWNMEKIKTMQSCTSL